jgi:hypothetical protein
LIALAVVPGETKRAYKYVAEAVRDALLDVHAHDICTVQYGCSDNVPHVRLAMEEVFPDLMMVNCWSHLCIMGLRPNSGGVWKHLKDKSLVGYLRTLLERIHNLVSVDAVGANPDLQTSACFVSC